MTRVVPMIRAGVVFPLIRLAAQNGHGVTGMLQAAGLSSLRDTEPFYAVPLLSCLSLLDQIAQVEAPDFCCHAITPECLTEIAVVSRLGLGAASPHEAMIRISAMMAYHCTHENLSLSEGDDQIVLRDRFLLPMNPLLRHLVGQYVAAVARQICLLTGTEKPPFRRVALAPHPEYGVAHLEPWFGPVVVAVRSDTLAVTIGTDVADLPLLRSGRDRREGGATPGVMPLRGDGTLAGSIRMVLPHLFQDGVPTLDRVAGVAGTSRRTLQRLLAQEGTSLSALIEQSRREAALSRLAATGEPLRQLSSSLGYAQQSALTRAVRRWTGQVPRDLRLPRTG